MPTPPPTHAPDGDKQSASVGSRDVGKVSFSGLAEPCAIGSLVEVVINAQGAAQGSVLVEAIAPTGKVHRCQVLQRGNTFTATFTPNEVGEWQIAIMYDGEHIRGSPFVCHVYDANLVRVYGLDVGVVGQELKFNVNTSQAGRGDVQVNVSHHGRSIPCFQEKQGPSLYRVQFTPDGAGHYKIHVYFNNMEVKGSPFSLDIVDASSVSVYGDNLRMASVDKLATFMIHAVGADSKDLTVTINAPSGKKKRARVVPIGDSTYRVEWKPVEAGEHYIDVRLYNQSVQDSPFSCNVGDPELVTVRNMPTHLKHMDLGEPQNFEIDASAAGSGNLEILINGGRVSCKVKELGNRLYLATFVPVHPVTHTIEMRFNGEPVKGSPWRIEISLPSTSGETQSTQVMAAVGAPPGFPLGSVILAAPLGFPGGTTPITNYAAYLTAAPTNFQTTMANTTGTTMTTFSSEIERVTEEMGSTRLGATAGGPQWADIEGRGLTMASVGKISTFEIGGRGLNVDDIIARITGPSGKEVPARVITARTGNFRVEYVTSEVGTYRIDLSLTGRPVDGSPFYVTSYAPQRVFIDPIPGGAVGQPVQFFVDANEAGKGQLEISVNQGQVPNNVQMQGTARCLVTFIPENAATYVIDVTFNGELVRGCPIRVEIYDQETSPGLVDRRPVGTDAGSPSRYIRQSPSSPTRGTRAWSPAVVGGGFGTSGATYSYERREYSTNNYTNGDRGVHTSSVNYYLPGQPVTVHLTPVTTTATSTSVTTTTSTIPPAPPPPPAPSVLQASGKPLVRSWQHKTTPIEPQAPNSRPVETKRFEVVETKRFESMPSLASESKNYFKPVSTTEFGQDDKEVPFYPQQPRNGSAVYDRSVSPKEQTKSLPHAYRPRVTESTSMIEEEHHVSRSHHRPGSYEKQRSLDEYHKAPDRFYKYEIDQDQQITPLIDERSYASSKPEEKRYDEYVGARKYSDRQQAPPKADELPCRSEFEERLAKQAAGREGNYASGAQSDAWKGAATTVASYGVGAQSQGYRRPSVDTVPHVLSPEPELIHYSVLTPETELPSMPLVEKPDIGRRGPAVVETTAAYAVIEKEPKSKQEIQVAREIPVQRQADTYDPMQRAKPVEVAPMSRYAAPEHQTQGYRRHANGDVIQSHVLTPEPELPEDQKSPASWSASSASDIAEEEDIIHEHPKQREPETVAHLGTGPKHGSKVDLKSIKVEFPEASDTGNGVAVVRVRKPAYFEIKPAIFNLNDLKVNIITPSKAILDHRIRETRQGYVVEFTPTEVGSHKAHLQIREDTLFQSPYVIKVYDSDRIQVAGIETGIVGNPVQFTVDATNAGYGSLEIAIKDSEGNIIPSKVNAMQDSTSKFTVSFLPQKPDHYGIHISFNQENLKGSPFLVEVKERQAPRDLISVGAPAAAVVASQMAPEIVQQAIHSPPLQAQTNGAPKTTPAVTAATLAAAASSAKLVPDDRAKERSPKLVPVGKTATMLIMCNEKVGKPKVEVKGPNGKMLHTQVVDAGGGNYRIEFGPHTVGDHIIEAKMGENHVQGSPFTCRVYDARKIKISEIPTASIGKAVHFVVDASDAGVGNLEVAVNEGRIPSMAHGLGQHRYDISFVPKESIEHTISVRFNNESVPGSPFICKVVSVVTATGPGLERVSVKRPTSFTVDTHGAPPTALQVIIKDPTGQELPVHITGSADKVFNVEYTPQVIGNHSIDVRYGNCQVQNNPFMIKAYDASRVKLFPVEGNVIGKPSSFYIDAAKAGAGNMEIIVSVEGRNVPNFVTPEGNAKFKVSFTPQEASPHVVSVKFNGESVPGSPMTCNIIDEQAFAVIGDGLNQAVVGKPTSFIVHASEGADHDCNVVITAPSQQIVSHHMARKIGESGFNVQFTPTVIGPHTITVDLGKGAVSKGPFVCNVFDPSRVGVSKVGCGIVGKRMKVPVDISKAGDGVIKVNIADSQNRHSLPCLVVPTSMGSAYDVLFTPIDSTTLSISILFNEVEISGSPFLCEVFDSSRMEIAGSGLTLAQVDQVANFTVDLGRDGNGDDLVVQIMDPFKRLVPASMKKTPNDGTKYFIEYVPRDVGTHLIDVQFAQYQLNGCPFSCEAFDVKRVKISGLKGGQIGKEQKFQIDCAQAGQGYVDVFLRNKTNVVRCPVTQIGDGLLSCAFIPKTLGTHSIEVKFNEVALPGSPYDCFIRDTSSTSAQGPGLSEAATNKIAYFTVFLTGAGRGELDVVVTAPDGGAVPVKCFQQKDGNFRVEYAPNTTGTHRIDITFGDQPIAGGPFTCEVFDPDRVVVQPETHALTANQPAAIRVNRNGAGRAPMAVQVSDPNGKLLPVEVVPVSHSEDEIRFTPVASGQHHVSVSYGGYDVASSPVPVQFSVEEPGMPTAYGDGLSRAVVNEQSSFVVDVKKLKGELKVDVIDQNGQRVKHAVQKKGEGLYETIYTPSSPGHFTVTLVWNNKSLVGSPYKVSVLDPSKVLIAGASTDLPDGTPIRVGAEKELKIDASAAGIGKLRAEVRGPTGKLQTSLDDLGHGQHRLSFTPIQEGEHLVYLYWSDLPVPTCPATYVAKGSSKLGKKTGAESPLVGKDAGGRASAAGKVVVDAESFRSGARVGQEINVIIDARLAGPGELTAQCIGPNKLAYCELYGRRDGTYALQFKPLESGKHKLHVKYDGEQVPGSPFPVNVTSPPDPSKVRVYGPGIEPGILSKFKSDFCVDTQGAGAGQLTVRVRGPKGAFNVEMVRESKFDRQIRCKYEPKEPGDYQIEVKWANEHVPGSPFMVMIFDTQQELERFLAGQPVSSTPPLPFLPPGWVGPPPAGFLMPSPGAGPPAVMMPPSPVLPPGNFRQPPRAITYGGAPPFPVYAGGSPKHRHQNGYH